MDEEHRPYRHVTGRAAENVAPAARVGGGRGPPVPTYPRPPGGSPDTDRESGRRLCKPPTPLPAPPAPAPTPRAPPPFPPPPCRPPAEPRRCDVTSKIPAT